MGKVKKPRMDVAIATYKDDEGLDRKRVIISIHRMFCPWCGSRDVDVSDSEMSDCYTIVDYVECRTCKKWFDVVINTKWLEEDEDE